MMAQSCNSHSPIRLCKLLAIVAVLSQLTTNEAFCAPTANREAQSWSGNEPPILRVGQSQAPREVQQGQREAFSSTSTGLGDLEAFDSLEKAKKSVAPVGSSRHTGDESTISRPKRRALTAIFGNQKYGTGVKRGPRLVKRRGQLYALQSVDAENGLLPILVARRTGEPFEPLGYIDRRSQPEAEDQLGANFGSRVSLLTTRKMQPDSLASYAGQMDEWEGDQMEELEPVSSRALIEAHPSTGGGRLAKSGEREPDGSLALGRSDQLPRIARANS